MYLLRLCDEELYLPLDLGELRVCLLIHGLHGLATRAALIYGAYDGAAYRVCVGQQAGHIGDPVPADRVLKVFVLWHDEMMMAATITDMYWECCLSDALII